ncbi:MAG: hypothetical protein FD180_1133 [Planctomycetota bacterium]|nr:MAG: hypothetical protein FD180_1133 [Planctomycetota bacterium]
MKRKLVAGVVAVMLGAAGAALLRRGGPSWSGLGGPAGEASVAGPGQPGEGASGTEETTEEELSSGGGSSPERYKGRLSTRRNLVARSPARAPEKPDSVSSALRWLVKSQNASGSWGNASEDLDGTRWSPASATALAVLALLGAGHTSNSKELWDAGSPGEAVKRAEGWLAGVRPAGDREAALVTLSLSESFGMTRREEMGEVVRRAVAGLEARQRPDGSWGDSVESAWAVMALKSAELAEVEVDARVKEAARSWCSNRLETGTPADVMVWIFLTHERNPALARILNESAQRLPTAEAPAFEASYFGRLAAFQYDGPGGQLDKSWREALKRSHVATQEEDGGWNGHSGWTSRVVGNSLAALSLEFYYAYANVWSGEPKDEAKAPEAVAVPMPLPDEALPMGDRAPEDPVQDSGSDLPMGDAAPVEPE